MVNDHYPYYMATNRNIPYFQTNPYQIWNISHLMISKDHPYTRKHPTIIQPSWLDIIQAKSLPFFGPRSDASQVATRASTLAPVRWAGVPPAGSIFWGVLHDMTRFIQQNRWLNAIRRFRFELLGGWNLQFNHGSVSFVAVCFSHRSPHHSGRQTGLWPRCSLSHFFLNRNPSDFSERCSHWFLQH